MAWNSGRGELCHERLKACRASATTRYLASVELQQQGERGGQVCPASGVSITGPPPGPGLKGKDALELEEPQRLPQRPPPGPLRLRHDPLRRQPVARAQVALVRYPGRSAARSAARSSAAYWDSSRLRSPRLSSVREAGRNYRLAWGRRPGHSPRHWATLLGEGQCSLPRVSAPTARLRVRRLATEKFTSGRAKV